MSSNDVQFEQVQQSWREREAAYDQICAELLLANKAVLLTALAAAGITHVTV